MVKDTVCWLERAVDVIREVHVVGNIYWEVHLLATPCASLYKSPTCARNLSEVMQEVVAAHTILVSTAQHFSL